MFQARKEDSFELQNTGGHGPSRGLGTPCALNPMLSQNCCVRLPRIWQRRSAIVPEKS